jgi:hypothetical protein
MLFQPRRGDLNLAQDGSPGYNRHLTTVLQGRLKRPRIQPSLRD